MIVPPFCPDLPFLWDTPMGASPKRVFSVTVRGLLFFFNCLLWNCVSSSSGIASFSCGISKGVSCYLEEPKRVPKSF